MIRKNAIMYPFKGFFCIILIGLSHIPNAMAMPKPEESNPFVHAFEKFLWGAKDNSDNCKSDKDCSFFTYCWKNPRSLSPLRSAQLHRDTKTESFCQLNTVVVCLTIFSILILTSAVCFTVSCVIYPCLKSANYALIQMLLRFRVPKISAFRSGNPQVKCLTKRYTDFESCSEEEKKKATCSFRKAMYEYQVVALIVLPEKIIASTCPFQTIVINAEEDMPHLFNDIWVDPSIRKLVRGTPYHKAINARQSTDVLDDLEDALAEKWDDFFGRKYSSHITSEDDPKELCLINWVTLQTAYKMLINQGKPFYTVKQLRLCPVCASQDHTKPKPSCPKKVYCLYPLCIGAGKHSLLVCPVLQGFCQECGEIGHLKQYHKLFHKEKLRKAYEDFKNNSVLSNIGLDVFYNPIIKESIKETKREILRGMPPPKTKPATIYKTPSKTEPICSGSNNIGLTDILNYGKKSIDERAEILAEIIKKSKLRKLSDVSITIQ